MANGTTGLVVPSFCKATIALFPILDKTRDRIVGRWHDGKKEEYDAVFIVDA